MKKLLGWILLCAASTAGAQQTPTLSSVEGVIIKGLGEYDSFSITTGQTANCEVDPYFHKCDLEGARADIVTADTTEAIEFTRYLYSDRAVSGVTWEEWTYIGTWTRTIDGMLISSPARIRIYDRSDMPGIFGFLKIEDYDVTHHLKATVAR